MLAFTLEEFMEDYKGFDWENGTLVIVRKSNARSFIIGKDCIWRHLIKDYGNEPVRDWSHDENVMVITLDI